MFAIDRCSIYTGEINKKKILHSNGTFLLFNIHFIQDSILIKVQGRQVSLYCLILWYEGFDGFVYSNYHGAIGPRYTLYNWLDFSGNL